MDKFSNTNLQNTPLTCSVETSPQSKKSGKFQPHRFVEARTSKTLVLKLEGKLYEWNGHFHVSLPMPRLESEAYHWLVVNDPLHASHQNARASANSVLCYVDTLALQDPSIIATECKYFRVTKAGIAEVQPDPKYGVVHCYKVRTPSKVRRKSPSQFQAFIDRALPDPDVQKRVQEYLGSSLMPGWALSNVQFFIGDGANGKSVLANIIRGIHPSPCAIKLDSLDKFGLAEASAASILISDELPKQGLDEHILKAVVSGDFVQINRKHLSAVSTCITSRLVILGNQMPKIQDQSSGVWRRLEIVPFDVQIPLKEQRPDLAKLILETESDVVFQWLLAGLKRVLKRGFKLDTKKPALMEEALLKLRSRVDSLSFFIFHVQPRTVDEQLTPKRQAYAVYVEWCRLKGLAPLCDALFWKRLSGHLPNLATNTRKRIDGKQEFMCNLLVSAEWVK